MNGSTVKFQEHVSRFQALFLTRSLWIGVGHDHTAIHRQFQRGCKNRCDPLNAATQACSTNHARLPYLLVNEIDHAAWHCEPQTLVFASVGDVENHDSD